MANILTHAELVRTLDYDSITGVLTWRVRNSSRALVGAVAGCVTRKGHLVVRLNKRLYLAHRLAYFHFHGHMPPAQIDHRDGVKHNNQITNLRPATGSQNSMNIGKKSNNTSGYKGVKALVCGKRWSARYKIKGVSVYLGKFNSPEAASAAYVSATKVAFGEFFRP